MKCTACGKDNPDNAQFCGICGANLISGEASIGPGLPMVGFGEAIGRGFSNYITFSGRATPAEYWWWFLFSRLIGLIPFAGLVTLIPELAVTSRRLHDSGRSGWLQIIPWAILAAAFVSVGVGGAGFLFGIGMIAAIAGFIVLIVWLVRKGEEGPNKYGPDPRRPAP
ncbi:DUF805 domain-containing protein [Dehalococcoidia bacterium]|nr:DUF805 domain-containing protein [Dehalococcoidia bacterium]